MDNEDTSQLSNFTVVISCCECMAVQRGSQKSLLVDEGSGDAGYGVFSLHTDKTVSLLPVVLISKSLSLVEGD